VFFVGPYRRGQGLSALAAKYIGDEIAAATKAGGVVSGAATMVRLFETDHLNNRNVTQFLTVDGITFTAVPLFRHRS